MIFPSRLAVQGIMTRWPGAGKRGGSGVAEANAVCIIYFVVLQPSVIVAATAPRDQHGRNTTPPKEDEAYWSARSRVQGND
jgi:hypothetical protein